ncbi:MAG: hypothetical protein RMK31_07700 [Candidatus Caldarchaeum sp.]|nr:hypothetical protein [Candidatus Caldarchaeum sp.]
MDIRKAETASEGRRRRRIFILLLLTGVAVAAAATLLHQPSQPAEAYGFSAERARAFLESQLVPEAGLLRAAVHAEPDKHRIYIASDNLLASRALMALDSLLGRKIQDKLAAEHGHGFNSRHEVLFGVDIPDQFYAQTNVRVGEIYSAKFNITFEILYEKPDLARVMHDWVEYADLLAYRALEHLFQGRVEEARRLFSRLLAKWDGNGFRDKAYEGRYETYKVALALYLFEAFRKAAGDHPADEELVKAWRNLLAQMQREDGGVATHYVVEDGKPKHVGDANTETTSISVLAIEARKIFT